MGGALALFDLDNTLLDRATAFDAWLGLWAHGLGMSDDDIAWVREADGDGRVSREEFFDAVSEHFGLSEGRGKVLDHYWAHYPELFRPDPEVIASVCRLQQEGWKVAVVTNGVETQQRMKLKNAGLLEVLDGWCISEEVGSAKPERVIFEEAARRCSMPLSGWMVGDTEVADIRGGRDAGLRTIWMPRGRTWGIAEYRPDRMAHSVAEAAALILGEP